MKRNVGRISDHTIELATCNTVSIDQRKKIVIPDSRLVKAADLHGFFARRRIDITRPDVQTRTFLPEQA
jgi:hypothetical protein